MLEGSEETMKRLQGKVALVTGAAQGIGRGIALCLAEEGANVAINEWQQLDAAVKVVERILSMGRRARLWSGDAANREYLQVMVEGVVEHFGQLDIVVANVAYTARQSVIEADLAGVERTVAVTQMGAFHLCQIVARKMVAQGIGGKIILIGSVHAEIPVARSGAYNMAKAAINHFSRTLAVELADHRINVNVINPGWIDTPGEREFLSEERIIDVARRLPWGRLGTPWDIGRAAVFLASDDADYITGTSLCVDGGLMTALTLPG